MWKGEREAVKTLREKVDPNAKYIWFHAASLGEFEQGRPLIEKIKKEYPDYKILLTFFSPSGYEVRKNYEQAGHRNLSAHRHSGECTKVPTHGATSYGFLH